MSALLAYWGKTTGTLNTSFTVDYVTHAATSQGSNIQFTYNGKSAGQTQAQIAAANFFLPFVNDMQLNDNIYASATDGEAEYFVSSITYPDNDGKNAAISISLVQITTGNIANHAVTYPKIQQVSASKLLGNPTGIVADVSEIGLGADVATNSLVFTGSTLSVSPLYSSFTASAALIDLIPIYETPFLVITNPNPTGIILVHRAVMSAFYLGGAYTNGGNLRLQYGNTSHAGGPAATTSAAASVFHSINVDSQIRFDGYQSNPLLNSECQGQNLYITNEGAAFGGDSGAAIFNVFIWYSIYEP